LKVEVIVQIGDNQNFRQIVPDIAVISLNREDRHVDGLLNIASVIPFTLWFSTVRCYQYFEGTSYLHLQG
jgi:hypothetical protein